METKPSAPIQANPVESNEQLLETTVQDPEVASEPARETWDKKLDFMLSCIGYAVGLGNIWRFPYLCYRNGGGAFLVPYFIFLLICGMPLFFLELTFGQFGALGPVSIWKIAPVFKGVGFCMLIISFLVCIYYNVIIAYSLHFIWNSCRWTLPWAKCDSDYNTPFCRDPTTNLTAPPTWTNSTCDKGYGWFEDVGTSTYNISSINTTEASDFANGAASVTINGSCVMYNTSAQEYFSIRVLQISSGIDETGSMNYELLIALIVAWAIVFICLFKGVKWSGKVVYFTATFPYFVLVALLIIGVQQEGAWEGVKFYITPNITKLGEIRVWSDAAVQIFYSLGAAWGVLLNYSSLNKFHNNVYRDALTVSTINCCTSVLAGFVVFSVLGSLAFQTGREVKDVVDQGAGLAFVAYPAAVANLPGAPVWAFLFFFMLLNLGLDSQFGMIEAVSSGLTDEIPWCRRNRVKFMAILCIVQFLLAIPMIMQSGMYWVTLVDWYASGLPLMIAAGCEIICISWVYGVDRFVYDLKCMIGYRPNTTPWWTTAWKFITPTCIILLIIFYMVFYSPVVYNGIKYPAWAEVVGWLSLLTSVLCIPAVAYYQVNYHPRAKGTFMERLKAVSQPDADWGPKDPEIEYRYNQSQKGQELIPIKEGNRTDVMAWCRDGSVHSDSSPPPAYEAGR